MVRTSANCKDGQFNMAIFSIRNQLGVGQSAAFTVAQHGVILLLLDIFSAPRRVQAVAEHEARHMAPPLRTLFCAQALARRHQLAHLHFSYENEKRHRIGACNARDAPPAEAVRSCRDVRAARAKSSAQQRDGRAGHGSSKCAGGNNSPTETIEKRDPTPEKLLQILQGATLRTSSSTLVVGLLPACFSSS
uniref:Uncharacterized protein n=1 Tax=Leersia perrieri TaxID=77586 RepID=A0A0D9WJK1_9ORYZ